MPTYDSVFAQWADRAWPYQYAWEAHVYELHGGTPRNPDMVRDWLRKKMGWTDEEKIEEEMARIFTINPEVSEAGLIKGGADQAAQKHVNGFRRDEEKGLYLECRCLKACIKEAASICRAANKIPTKYGATGLGVKSFFAEHVMVEGDRMYLGRDEHDELHTRFVRTWQGNGITVEEVAYDVTLSATVKADWPLEEELWGVLWLTAEDEGLGSSRSQGFGRFVTTKWEQVTTAAKPKRIKRAS